MLCVVGTVLEVAFLKVCVRGEEPIVSDGSAESLVRVAQSEVQFLGVFAVDADGSPGGQ